MHGPTCIVWANLTAFSLKWAHATAGRWGLDRARVGVWGEGSGGWVGLNLCRLLAEQGGGALVKVRHKRGHHIKTGLHNARSKTLSYGAARW